MRAWKKMRVRMRSLFDRSAVEQELDAELQFHIEKQIEENRAAGLSNEEARYSALRVIGPITQFKEECREMRGLTVIEDWAQDVRYGLRVLLRSPAFTAVAVLSLALGIGANSAIFSLLNAVLLRTLPVENPGRLFVLTHVTGPGQWFSFSYPLYRSLRGQSHVLSGLTAASESDVDLEMSAFGSSESVRARLVTGNYFSVLGVAAAAGRTLTPEDDQIRNGVVVISNDLWMRRFGQASSAIGQQFALNGSAFTIVGVTPPGFFGESVGTSPEMWLSTTLQSQLLPGAGDPSEQRDNGWLRVIARLKPGIAAKQAQSELNLIFQQYRVADFGSTESAGYRKSLAQERIDLSPGGKGPDFLRRQFSQPLLVLMAMVGLVLLLACANTANLLLGRAAARRKEIAMRLAIGATSGRIMRQLLTESVLLSTIAGSVGLLLARGGSQALLLMASRGTNPLFLNAALDVRVLIFTVVVSLVTGLLFGSLPARQCMRPDATPSLKASRSGRLTPGKLIVVSQVTISLLLLIGGSLFVRSLRNLTGFDPGFRRDSVIVADIDARMAGYERPQFVALYQRLLERLNRIPGVRSSSLSLFNLMSNSGNISSIFAAGRVHQDKDSSYVDYVSASYFSTVGMNITLGRGFDSQTDGEGAPKVAVVNERMAHYFFPGETPIGKRIGFGSGQKSAAFEIVGVVKDARYDDLKADIERRVFLPYLQNPANLHAVQVSTAIDPKQLTVAVRNAIREVDPRLPVKNVVTLRQVVDDSLLRERLVAKLSGFFGLLALLLAAIGLYAVMSQTVLRRTKEIGIRIAVGAEQSAVLWQIMRQALGLVLAGICLAVPIALATGRLIANQLYGVGPHDPITFVVAVAVLLGVSTFAAYLPARRAARVDPMVALREE